METGWREHRFKINDDDNDNNNNDNNWNSVNDNNHANHNDNQKNDDGDNNRNNNEENDNNVNDDVSDGSAIDDNDDGDDEDFKRRLANECEKEETKKWKSIEVFPSMVSLPQWSYYKWEPSFSMLENVLKDLQRCLNTQNKKHQPTKSQHL